MNILFCATVDSHIQHFHTRIIHQLAEKGDSIDLASNGIYTNADIHEKFNIPFSRNPLSSDNRKAYKQLTQILSTHHYDVISCHTPIAGFLIRYAARKYPKIKVVYTAHGFHFYKGCPIENEVIYKTAERIAAHYTDVLITINSEDYEASKHFQLKQGGKYVLIPGVGIDLEEIHKRLDSSKLTRADLGLKEDDIVLLSVGEINRNKNHLFVIQALKDMMHSNPRLKYVICGNGTLLEEYKRIVKHENLENSVILLGYRKDAIEIMKISDIFVFPSLREGLPLSIMEAMACGLPIIASNIRGNKDLIENGINGLLFESNNKESFITALNRLLSDSKVSITMAQNSTNRIGQYSAYVIDQQILDQY